MQAEQVSEYHQRKGSSRCTRCGAPAAHDSSLCEPHRDNQRTRQARWVNAMRTSRRADGLCPYCPKRQVAPLQPGQLSCLACRIRRHKLSPSGGVDNGVDKQSRIAARTVTHDDGRTRYHGQHRRGQQPAAQLNRQDADLAAECFDTFRQGLDLLNTDDVKALPRVQRDDVKSAVAHQGDRAIRHIEDVLERLGHFKIRHGKRDGE